MPTTIAPASDAVPTPALFRHYSRTVWRLVEAQHRISTNRLAANNEDQALLEHLVEEVKPVLPPAARGLHYLLATPFRYGHAKPSRFRRAHEHPGIFYASEHIRTAIIEAAYWRLLFFSRSPGFVPPATVVEHSAFSVKVNTEQAIDLTAPPFLSHAEIWTDPADYTACQDLAAGARRIGAHIIRYTSARDPERRANVALLDPAAFMSKTPKISQSWHFRYERGNLTAFAALPSDERHSFTFEQFGLTGPC